MPAAAAIQSPTHADLIVALGGAQKVRDAVETQLGINLTLTAVSMWKIRGIPPEYRPFIADLAKPKRLALPAKFILRAK